MMEIWDILMYALPSGFASGWLTWLVSRRTFAARNKKEREDVYRALYDDLSATTLDLSRQVKKLNERIVNHETALRKCHSCKYADRCPALLFMRQLPPGKPDSHPLGQPPHERHRANGLRAGPDEEGDPDADGDTA